MLVESSSESEVFEANLWLHAKCLSGELRVFSD
jgi:hypothetical protein